VGRRLLRVEVAEVEAEVEAEEAVAVAVAVAEEAGARLLLVGHRSAASAGGTAALPGRSTPP